MIQGRGIGAPHRCSAADEVEDRGQEQETSQAARNLKLPPKFYGKAALAKERLRVVYLTRGRGGVVVSRAGRVGNVIQFSPERCCRRQRDDFEWGPRGGGHRKCVSH